MALITKRGSGVITVEDRTEAEHTKTLDGKTTTYTETHTVVKEGPFATLKTEATSFPSAAPAAGVTKTSSLSRTDAGQGRLTLVTKTVAEDVDEEAPDPPAPDPPAETVTEIEWVDLRKKLEENPRYASLTVAQIGEAKKHADDPAANPIPTDATAAELAEKLARGQTEYSIAAPVVRSTTYHSSIPATSAYIRSSPPYSPSGTWQWIKTADRAVRQGRYVTRTQEWTGTKEWDTDIYP